MTSPTSWARRLPARTGTPAPRDPQLAKTRVSSMIGRTGVAAVGRRDQGMVYLYLLSRACRATDVKSRYTDFETVST
jgi:hypothetical protein